MYFHFCSSIIKYIAILICNCNASGDTFEINRTRNVELDLGVIIHLGATAVYTEGPLLEGTFFVISHYMFQSNWPSSGVTG
jgi:hypothetical protein